MHVAEWKILKNCCLCFFWTRMRRIEFSNTRIENWIPKKQQHSGIYDHYQNSNKILTHATKLFFHPKRFRLFFLKLSSRPFFCMQFVTQSKFTFHFLILYHFILRFGEATVPISESITFACLTLVLWWKHSNTCTVAMCITKHIRRHLRTETF